MYQPTTVQDAVRLLFILGHGAEMISEHPEGFVGVFDGKAKLHALDFWVRYPDFLAYELLNRFDETNDSQFVDVAREIINNREPDLRSIPMIRYRFGAFEDLNESLSLLISNGLIHQRGHKADGKIQNYQYYIIPLDRRVTEEISVDFPILVWYNERSQLVKQIAGALGGTALKEMQYLHLSYAQTKLGTVIPSIKDEVIARLNTIS